MEEKDEDKETRKQNIVKSLNASTFNDYEYIYNEDFLDNN